MKKMILFFTVILTVNLTFGQRYLTEVFSTINTTDEVVYAQNFSVLTTVPVLQDLKMTVYEPSGDVFTERPLIIFLPTGNFLPKGVNQTPVGSRKDSAAVEICTRLAKRGYVVASLSYRLGWNPVDPNQDGRTGSLLRAVYRAVQDGRTAVRYFRKNAVENGNTFKIDPLRIGVVGEGSGGYVALAMATLSDPSEMALTKFYDFTNNQPYVIPSIMGNLEGLGGNPIYNRDNHIGYNSSIDLCVNIGGALGDSSWIEAGDAEMVSFHCVSDPYAPFGNGDVIVPTTGDFVVSVSGSQVVQMLANNLGNNDLFENAGFNDAFTLKANQINGGYDGLYPFYTSDVQGAPWQWWDTSDTYHNNGLATNMNMSKTKAMTYIDTILGYLSPRAHEALVIDSSITGIKSMNHAFVKTQIFPNPNNGHFTIESNNKINTISIIAVDGKILFQNKTVEDYQALISISNLPRGFYFVEIITSSGPSIQQVVVQ